MIRNLRITSVSPPTTRYQKLFGETLGESAAMALIYFRLFCAFTAFINDVLSIIKHLIIFNRDVRVLNNALECLHFNLFKSYKMQGFSFASNHIPKATLIKSFSKHHAQASSWKINCGESMDSRFHGNDKFLL